jgi:hypothetical protein
MILKNSIIRQIVDLYNFKCCDMKMQHENYIRINSNL